MLKIKPSETKHIINAAMKDPTIVPMIWGAPGIGKTAVAAQAAKDNGFNYLQVILAERDAPDIVGHCYRDGKEMLTSRSDILRKIEESDKPTLLHLDEVPQAVMMLQNIASRIVHDRVLGEGTLPESTAIVLSGNMRQHKAGTFEMPMHLKNRLAHVEMIADRDDFRVYSGEHDINPMINAYLEWRPDHLSMFDASQYANPSPRTWEKTSNVLAMKIPQYAERALITGLIGEGVSNEFFGFMKIASGLPHISDIFDKPESVNIANDPATIYALMGAVANHATTRNMDVVRRILNRISSDEFRKKEYCVSCLKEMQARNPNLMKTKAGIDLAVSFSNVIL